MYTLLFTYYSLSSTDYPKEPRCPQRNRRTTGSPMASCLPWTHTPGGSVGCQRRPLSHPNSWEWRAMLPLVSSTSWMTMARVTALASATWHLATVRPGSAPWRILQDTHRRKRSPHELTPLRTLMRRPPSSHVSTGRIYDDSGHINHRPHQRARRTTLRSVRIDQ